MSDGYYLDNDVVLKTCSYGVGTNLVALGTIDDVPPAILALARFTVRSRIERSRVLVDKAAAAADLGTVLERVRLLEPTTHEVEIAANLEEAATSANLSFDTGESQLVAMLLERGGLAFLTGDKRAARALRYLLPDLTQRLVCLEQVIYSVVASAGVEPLRTAVCREKESDRAIAICIQCSSPDVGVSSILQALESYTNSLRGETGDLLVSSAGISATKIA